MGSANYQQAKIGLYDENKILIGYKADSFWSLSKKHPKMHTIERGKIEPHLLSNLNVVLRGGNNDSLVGRLQGVNKARFFDHFETMLVGYVVEGSDTPIFTHRVFPDGIEELDERDSADSGNSSGRKGGASTELTQTWRIRG